MKKSISNFEPPHIKNIDQTPFSLSSFSFSSFPFPFAPPPQK
jgi:hypothetical protein